MQTILDSYIQFHPVAYIVKLQIEMSMANLIAKLARSRTELEFSTADNQSSPNHTSSHQKSNSQAHVSTEHHPNILPSAHGRTQSTIKNIDASASVCSKTDLIVGTRSIRDEEQSDAGTMEFRMPGVTRLEY